jgi:hypothetical protein
MKVGPLTLWRARPVRRQKVLIPTSWQIVPDVWHALLRYLNFHVVETPGAYNALQQLSYAAVIFLLAPFSIATGIAMSGGSDWRQLHSHWACKRHHHLHHGLLALWRVFCSQRHRRRARSRTLCALSEESGWSKRSATNLHALRVCLPTRCDYHIRGSVLPLWWHCDPLR